MPPYRFLPPVFASGFVAGSAHPGHTALIAFFGHLVTQVPQCVHFS